MTLEKFVSELTKLKKINSISFRNKGGYITNHYLNTAYACEQFVKDYGKIEITIKDIIITKSKINNGYNVKVIQEGENENN